MRKLIGPATAAALAMLSAGGASAQTGDSFATRAPQWAELIAAAQAAGSVRVIVRLATVADTGGSEARLLADLERLDTEVIRRYRSLPLVTLSVTTAGLGYLLGSPLVVSIEPDAALRAQQPAPGGSDD